MMARLFSKYVSVAALVLLLSVVAAGCGTDDETGGAVGPAVNVGLYTKNLSGETEGDNVSRRLLVFDSKDVCVSNYSFIPGSGTISLVPGTYRMVTLNAPKGLQGLPAAGETNGVRPDMRLSFDNSALSGTLSLGMLETVTFGKYPTSYTATLNPVTSMLSLRISDMPEGLSAEFKLTGMYASIGLDGTYGGSRDCLLAINGETVCFPTSHGAKLTYSVDGGNPRSLDLGRKLEAGNRLQVELAWSDDQQQIVIRQTTVTDWIPGGGDDSAEAN